MYLRHTTVSKSGKTHTYWRLVRSVRVGSKVRQETVAQLGELDAQGRVRARALAQAIVGVERQPGLFDDDLPHEPVHVDLRRFRLERGRRFAFTLTVTAQDPYGNTATSYTGTVKFTSSDSQATLPANLHVHQLRRGQVKTAGSRSVGATFGIVLLLVIRYL